MDPELKAFIDRVIVPALVERFLRPPPPPEPPMRFSWRLL